MMDVLYHFRAGRVSDGILLWPVSRPSHTARPQVSRLGFDSRLRKWSLLLPGRESPKILPSLRRQRVARREAIHVGWDGSIRPGALLPFCLVLSAIFVPSSAMAAEASPEI